MITVAQDPDAHLFWEVDWTDWLEARGYTDTDIEKIEWSAPGVTVTHEMRIAGKCRIWIKDVPLNKTSRVTCRIEIVSPATDVPPVADEYSFALIGRHK